MYNDHFNGTTNIGQIRVIVFIFSSLNKKKIPEKFKKNIYHVKALNYPRCILVAPSNVWCTRLVHFINPHNID